MFIVIMSGIVACGVHTNQTTTVDMTIEKTNPLNQNIELGKVTWYRNYQDALQKSKETGKPVLLFFQEIPGCATCVNYGRNVLSHPLMVELIETEFIPLAIYNNKPGYDAQILSMYSEPSWNNPVAHFIDESGKDIIPKLENNYEPVSMLKKIMQVLAKRNVKMPEYAYLLEKDLILQYGYTKTTIYETPCFWSGETSLAQQQAVLSTEPGFVNSKEVVKVIFNPEISNEKVLDSYAIQQGFYKENSVNNFRPDKDPQYYLKQTNYRYLPLTQAQRTQINQSLPYKDDAEKYLSPLQTKWLHHAKLKEVSSPNTYMTEINSSWRDLKDQLQ